MFHITNTVYCQCNKKNYLSELSSKITGTEKSKGSNVAIVFGNERTGLTDEELAARKAKWQPKEPKVKTGYLARYASLVTSANKGAILKQTL